MSLSITKLVQKLKNSGVVTHGRLPSLLFPFVICSFFHSLCSVPFPLLLYLCSSLPKSNDYFKDLRFQEVEQIKLFLVPRNENSFKKNNCF